MLATIETLETFTPGRTYFVRMAGQETGDFITVAEVDHQGATTDLRLTIPARTFLGGRLTTVTMTAPCPLMSTESDRWIVVYLGDTVIELPTPALF